MAIINSILMGKARGKVGNVVLNTIHGITTAKQCPSKGDRGSSPAQVTAKQKFSNAYQYYVWQKTFLSNIRKLAKMYEQLYNVYLREFYEFIPLEKPYTLLESFLPFLESNIGYYPAFQPMFINNNNNVIWLNAWTTNDLMFDNFRIRVILINTVTNTIFNRSFRAMPYQWNDGKFDVHNTIGSYDYGAFYLYSTDKKTLSKVYYGKIVTLV